MRKFFARPFFKVLPVLALVLVVGVISGCTPNGRANGFGRVVQGVPSAGELKAKSISSGSSLDSFFFALNNDAGGSGPNGAFIYKNLDKNINIRSEEIYDDVFFTNDDVPDGDLIQGKRLNGRDLAISPRMEQLMRDAMINGNSFKAVAFVGSARGTMGNEEADFFVTIAIDFDGGGEDIIETILYNKNGSDVYEAYGTLANGNIRVLPGVDEGEL